MSKSGKPTTEIVFKHQHRWKLVGLQNFDNSLTQYFKIYWCPICGNLKEVRVNVVGDKVISTKLRHSELSKKYY